MMLLTILMPALIAAPALPDDWDGLRRERVLIAWATLCAGFTNGNNA